MTLDPGSKNRLMPQHAALFTGTTLFDELARAVCGAGCLPRKELYEAWEVARRTRRRFRGGRVVDWAAGHGLLAYVMLLLDDTSPDAVAFDPRPPDNAPRLAEAIVARWPRLAGRIHVVTAAPALGADDVLVSCHACGALTDDVLTAALACGCRVAVLPCCHHLQDNDDGGLDGWLDGALAIDVTRAARMRQAGFTVRTSTIPVDITPKNRLLLAEPPPGSHRQER